MTYIAAERMALPTTDKQWSGKPKIHPDTRVLLDYSGYRAFLINKEPRRLRVAVPGGPQRTMRVDDLDDIEVASATFDLLMIHLLQD